jgi:hypothetical protein
MDAEKAAKHTRHVAIDYRFLLPEGNAGNGSGGVGPDAG